MTPRPRYEAPQYRGSAKLAGKAALITGGDSGIGRAVAVLFAREGADVAIVYLSPEQRDAEDTRSAVEAEGQRCELLPGDVTDPAFCARAIKTAAEKFGRLDVLVNNAAYQQHQASLEKITNEQLDRTFRTNIYGYFYMARAALAYLPAGGAIINTGSITGLEGSEQLLDYSATKGAIHAFTKSLASNLLDKGIRVNAVAPGPVWTPLQPSGGQPQEKVVEFGKNVPLKRPGQPVECAPVYVLLASQEASFITGETYGVTGGHMLP